MPKHGYDRDEIANRAAATLAHTKRNTMTAAEMACTLEVSLNAVRNSVGRHPHVHWDAQRRAYTLRKQDPRFET